MTVLPPSPDQLQNSPKGRKNVLSCGFMLSFVEAETQMSSSPDKDWSGRLLWWKGLQELVQGSVRMFTPFPTLPLHLILSGREIHYFFCTKMIFLCVYGDSPLVSEESRASRVVLGNGNAPHGPHMNLSRDGKSGRRCRHVCAIFLSWC